MKDFVSYQFYDGAYQATSSDKVMSNYYPGNGRLLCSISVASKKDVDKAIASAEKGFEIWSQMSGTARGRILKRAAFLLRERTEEIAHIEVEDTGKPISEALEVDVATGADALEYFGGIAASLHGDYYDLEGSFAYTRREPLGVCAGIGAWNYPVQIACWKAAPALACGNSMVFKPAELTPRSALILAEVLKEAGVPDGVFNVIQGDAEVGQMLTEDERIRKVSLTGEVGTGRKVMASAAKTLKHVTLELGGKSPLIICDDADIDQAVDAAMIANFYTQGEICSNGTRVFVHQDIKAEFLEKLIAKTKSLKVGDPMDKQTEIGALISQEHYEKVLTYIEQGKNEAKLLTGGKAYTEISEGYYVVPTIFDVPNDEAIIAKEEIFGPVMSVLTFTNEKEVIDRANATPFGLAAGVFTRDIQRAHRMVAKLQAGMCWINTYNDNPMEIPFGPYKQSGFGKENGLAALDAYSQLKTVQVQMEPIVSPYK